jgi:hypothetical protein
MSQTIVKQRVNSIIQHSSTPLNRRLTPVGEENLKQWILSRDQRGMPPRITTIRQIASLLVT